jgi:putative restriction endonuclease
VLDVIKFVEPAFDEEVDIKALNDVTNATERQQLILARRGQGEFRQRLFSLWDGRCAVTGCTITEVLRASHMKPWRSSDNRERLDPCNGLLLTATLDALFDRGLIAFDDEGEMMLSKRIPKDQEAFLMHEPQRLRKQLSVEQREYLEAHRQQIFRP